MAHYLDIVAEEEMTPHRASTLIREVQEAVDRCEARFAELRRENAEVVRLCRIRCMYAVQACAEWRRSAAMIWPGSRELDRGGGD